MQSNDIAWYDLTPVYKKDLNRGGFATAALRQCILTGETLDSSGGPGFSLSVEAVNAINRHHNDTKARVIVDAEDLDKLLELADVRTNFSDEEKSKFQELYEKLRS